MDLKYILKLYIAGQTARSSRAIANLRKLCEESLQDQYELRVFDVLENPEMAETDKVMATPTLIRELPPPMRRIIGDLSNRDKVFLGLDITTVED
ncbi:MAG: circadian clock protein KaiB [Candidatus Eremiobacteraeota bacterium]|nr:circadian clock protein KaiB [Candidatus Eremiobacteraeota bacterium]